MTEEKSDATTDVMMRLQVIASLQGLVDKDSISGESDMYAAAARKALRSLQHAHSELFAATE